MVSHLQNNSGNGHQILLSRYFREELKQRIQVRPVPGKPHGVLLSYKCISLLKFSSLQSQHEELKKQHSDLEEEHRRQGEDFSRTFNDHKQRYLQLQQEKEQELSKLKGIWKPNEPVCMEMNTHINV